MMLAVTNDAAAQLVAVLEEFRKIDPQLSLQAMMTFVAIAREADTHEGRLALEFREVAQLVSLSKSAANRMVNLLDEGWSYEDKWVPGHALVMTGVSARDARVKEVRGLTLKGRLVWSSIKRILEV
jgi:hypothetical protein